MIKDSDLARTFVSNVMLVFDKDDLSKVEAECGVCQGYLAKVKKNKTSGISLVTAKKFADAAGVSIDELLDPDFNDKHQYMLINKKIEKLYAEKLRLMQASNTSDFNDSLIGDGAG